ncbi:hypothetical protein D3C77_687040 [compost metagenome]
MANPRQAIVTGDIELGQFVLRELLLLANQGEPCDVALNQQQVGKTPWLLPVER